MAEERLEGTPASPGIAVGVGWQRAGTMKRAAAPVAPERRQEERQAAITALAAAAAALTELAAGLPAEEAEIVETGVLIAQDPALIQGIEDAIVVDGLDAAQAIIRATDQHASQIAALPDRTLAARGDDVRSIGRRAAALAAGQAAAALPGTDLILLAHDLGPADVAEFAPALAGIALAGGGATAHAAIVARSLGIPMVTGLYEAALEIADGAQLVIDGSSGTLIRDPSESRATAARGEVHARRAATTRAHERRDQPATTTDGLRITVLANVASPEELEVGLRAGAEGIGLLRTELAFLDARDWPTEQQHTDALAPILAGLGDRPAVVRVLDFGADKSPPFLQDAPERGLELLLANPDPFAWQLRTLLLASQRHDVRLLLPMVHTPEQVAQTSELLRSLARPLGIDRIPPLGSMIETPAAADNSAAIAAQSDFLSIGTNDLTAAVLGADRFATDLCRAHHPLVLRSIVASVAGAHGSGLKIEVCGEAASDPMMLPLLVGFGIDELSVGAARVGAVRDWIRRLDASQAAGLARSALTLGGAEEVEMAVRPLTGQDTAVR